MPDRWLRSSTTSACARLDLVEWDYDVNARGRRVVVWALDPSVETIRLTGEQL